MRPITCEGEGRPALGHVESFVVGVGGTQCPIGYCDGLQLSPFRHIKTNDVSKKSGSASCTR